MPETPAYSVSRADWPVDEAEIAHIRRAVFIREQSVPETLEWEALDPDCAWFVARAASGEALGIVRLTPDGRVGRMAVLPAWRRRGVGAALLAAALAEARRRGLGAVRLSAQTHAEVFYARFGFKPQGAIYQDAGIPHIAMSLTFKDSP